MDMYFSSDFVTTAKRYIVIVNVIIYKEESSVVMTFTVHFLKGQKSNINFCFHFELYVNVLLL